jgi:hypothetical protein
MVRWYATEDADPDEDPWLPRDRRGASYDGDPLTAGINSVRGAAAETISALLWPRPQRLPLFANTLRSLCTDRVDAVRACAALAVLTVAKHDEVFARELLEMLVPRAHDGVLATPYVERCIARFKADPGPRLRDLVRRMATSPVPACGVPVRGSVVPGVEWIYRLGIRAVCDGYGDRGHQTRYGPTGSAQRDQAARWYSWIKPPSTSTRCTGGSTAPGLISVSRVAGHGGCGSRLRCGRAVL